MHIKRVVVTFKRRYSRHYTKADRPLHPCTILCRVTVNGIPASDFSTAQHLMPQDWDQANQQARESCPDVESINKALAKIRARLMAIWNRYECFDMDVTADQVVSEFLNRKTSAANGQERETKPKQVRIDKRKTAITLRTLLALHLTHKQSYVVADSENSLSQETVEVYTRYTSNIEKYLLETGNETLTIDLVDAEWMSDFERFLTVRYDSYYMTKHLYYVKTVIDHAVLKKYLQYNPVKSFKIRKVVSDAELVFLQDDETARFELVDIYSNPGLAVLAPQLALVRDAFLAMVEIGQHYRDYKDFVANPIASLVVVQGFTFFKKKRQKTGQVAIVPISKKLMALADKYGGLDKLPVPNLAEFNQLLKVLAALAGINKNLSSKAARKTFADKNINEDEIDLDTVAKMLGLSSTHYLERYGRIDERRIIKKMGLHRPDAGLSADVVRPLGPFVDKKSA